MKMNYRQCFSHGQAAIKFSSAPAECADYLNKIVASLEERRSCLERVQDTGIRNQDIYLTWDEMDVYFCNFHAKTLGIQGAV